MTCRRVLACIVLVVAGWLATATLHETPQARADDPSPTSLVASPPPTIGVATPEVVATDLPTVSAERSTPVVTPAPPPTSAPDVISTSAPTAPVVRPRRARPTMSSTTIPQAVPAPVAAPAPSTPGVYAPLPSPAELRLNVRLRWGTHAPAKVRRWAFLIVPAAHKYKLDPNLIAAVMTMESNGDPLAWSGADARGLMQVLHGPWDPHQNVDTGARMLSSFIGQFGTIPLALAAYNAGPGAVQTYGGVPPYRETRDYVIVVSYLYDLFSHHRLSTLRREVFKRTLHDLTHFADQRRKIAKLARIAHIQRDPVLLCDKKPELCAELSGSPTPTDTISLSHDPFWPLSGPPDPLQRVDPYALP